MSTESARGPAPTQTLEAEEMAVGERTAGELTVTVLGCGTSTGVPVVGCDCEVCTSDAPMNQRMRPSLCLRWGDRVIVVDTGPDLRRQCLRFGIRRVDAVLYTHAHADHIFGLDDLRPFGFRQQGKIPCYGASHTLEQIRRTFAYAFDDQPTEGGGKPRLRTVEIRDRFRVLDLELEAIPVLHGSLEVTAYRCGDFAYVTDTNHVPDASVERLKGVDVLLLDALRFRPHATHFSVDQAIELSRRVGARRTFLTHLNHEVDYDAPQVPLPPGVEFAYDGLEFRISIS